MNFTDLRRNSLKAYWHVTLHGTALPVDASLYKALKPKDSAPPGLVHYKLVHYSFSALAVNYGRLFPFAVTTLNLKCVLPSCFHIWSGVPTP